MIDENGVNLGVMSLDKGLEVAKEREFDLVQISPNEEPVCRLMDFDKTMEEKARSRVESLVCMLGIRVLLNTYLRIIYT